MKPDLQLEPTFISLDIPMSAQAANGTTRAGANCHLLD